MNLEELIKKRDDFLRNYPYMQEYQNKIDEILNKCTNQNDRAIAVFIMLNTKLNELNTKLNELF